MYLPKVFLGETKLNEVIVTLVHFSFSEVIHLVYLIKRTLQTEAAISKTDLFFKLASLDTIQAVVFILSDLLQFSSNCLDCVAADYYKFKCQIQLEDWRHCSGLRTSEKNFTSFLLGGK